MYSPTGALRIMKKAWTVEKIRYAKAFAALMTVSVVLAGCAPQTRTFAPGMSNALSGPKFRYFIVNYPSADPDSSMGDLYAQVRYDDLIFIKTDTSYAAHYQLSINLYSDREMTESRYSETFDRKIAVSKYSQILSNSVYDGFKDKIVAKPGKYFIGLRLLDLNTNITSSKEIEYNFKDFLRDSINISDVVVHDSPDTTLSGTVRGPDTFADFYLTSQKVPVNVSLHMIAKSTESPASIDTVYELNQISRVQRYRLPININGLASSVYDLKISAGEDFAETSFRILRNRFSPNLVELDREIGPLAYIMTRENFDSLKDANSEEREKILNAFWTSKAHGDTAVSSAIQKEFYKRVENADEQFGTQLLQGWQTDRGRIYILYGKPDRIENHLNSFRAGPDANSPPHEVWYYSSLNLRFVFIDEFRDGNYRLVRGGT
jgi:GWxTD domain-containing protein